MRPPLGGSWPVITLKRVVLPAPFGPMTARRSRASRAKRHAGQRGERAEGARDAVYGEQGGGEQGERHERTPTRPRRAPTMPPGAKSTKSTKVSPRMSIQRSVYELTRLCSRMKAAAPSHAPVQRARAADDHHEERLARGGPEKRVGRDGADELGVERAGHARHRPAMTKARSL